MSNPPKVALAGATGNLGPTILKELLDANLPVTVLTRSASSKLPQHANLIVKEVDYNSEESLVSALQGIDVVVSNVTSFVGDIQKLLIQAAVKAGVSRFLPSEFGSDISNPLASKLPVFLGKGATRKQLEDIVAQNPSFSYTYLVCAPFLDWGIQVGFLVNGKDHTATLFDGGDVPFSSTTLSTVGKAVVGVVTHLDETKNRDVKVHDGVFTQNQLIEVIKKIDGKPWKTEVKTTDETFKWANEQMAIPEGKGKIQDAMVAYIHVNIFKPEYGNILTDTWNEKFDLPLFGEKELEEAVRDTIKGL